MRCLKAGGTFYGILTTHSLSTGAAAAPDATPTATAITNNAIDAAFVLTVNATPVATGIYKISGTVPVGYTAGDSVVAMGTYVMGGITRNEVIGEFTVVSANVYDSMVAGTDKLEADLVLVNGAAFTLDTTVSSGIKVIRAVLSGVAEVTDNGDGTSSIAYKDTNGTTTVVTVTCSNTVKGSRTASVEA